MCKTRVYDYAYIAVCLPIYLFICLSIYLSIYLSIDLPIYPSISILYFEFTNLQTIKLFEIGNSYANCGQFLEQKFIELEINKTYFANNNEKNQIFASIFREIIK